MLAKWVLVVAYWVLAMTNHWLRLIVLIFRMHAGLKTSLLQFVSLPALKLYHLLFLFLLVLYFNQPA